MKDHSGEFSLFICEHLSGNKAFVLKKRPLDDPFIRTTIKPCGWRVAWAVLLGRYVLHIKVDGSSKAIKNVMTADYTDEPGFTGYPDTRPMAMAQK